jgi:hypothetical protein
MPGGCVEETERSVPRRHLPNCRLSFGTNAQSLPSAEAADYSFVWIYNCLTGANRVEKQVYVSTTSLIAQVVLLFNKSRASETRTGSDEGFSWVPIY